MVPPEYRNIREIEKRIREKKLLKSQNRRSSLKKRLESIDKYWKVLLEKLPKTNGDKGLMKFKLDINKQIEDVILVKKMEPNILRKDLARYVNQMEDQKNNLIKMAQGPEKKVK